MTLREALLPSRPVAIAALMVTLLITPLGSSGAAIPTLPEVTHLGTSSLPKIGKWRGAEKKMMRWINEERADKGLEPLQKVRTLGYLARVHSRAMRAKPDLFHSDLGHTVRRLSWRAAGENVGVGPSAKQLHDAFMGSSGHKANVLGSYDRVGVGLVWDNGGTAWVTVLFLGR